MAAVTDVFTQPWVAYAFGVAAVLLFPVISKIATGSWIKGLIVGADGKLSTSKCQFWIWTEVVLFAYAFLFTSHVQGGLKPWCSTAAAATTSGNAGANAPQVTGPCSGKPEHPPTIPTDILILMGLSIVTAGTAKGIAAANAAAPTATLNAAGVRTLAATPPTPPVTRTDVQTAPYSGLVTDNQNGVVTSFSKVQLLTWSIVAACAYVVVVIAARASFFDATATGYPDIDPALVVLVGLGQGAYLGNKVASKTGTDV
jgi:hypothetical protein